MTLNSSEQQGLLKNELEAAGSNSGSFGQVVAKLTARSLKGPNLFYDNLREATRSVHRDLSYRIERECPACPTACMTRQMTADLFP